MGVTELLTEWTLADLTDVTLVKTSLKKFLMMVKTSLKKFLMMVKTSDMMI